MPVDLTELLESVVEPPMHVDADTVLARGRRRRLRRRLGRTAALVGAAAMVLPVTIALRSDDPPPPVTAGRTGCLFAQPVPNTWSSAPTSEVILSGRQWLDSGPPADRRDLRVRVNTDTCDGLAIAVSNGTSVGGTTADVTGAPTKAFWVVESTGGSVDRFGKVKPVSTMAVALLPPGQRVCGITTAPRLTPPKGQGPGLTEVLTTPAGHGWAATFATITGTDNPQRAAALKICDGTRTVEPQLPPLHAIVAPATSR